MKVRFLKSCMSALGVFERGKVYDLREKEARSLIAGGKAEEYKDEPPKVPVARRQGSEGSES